MNKIDKEGALDLFQHWLMDMPKAIERLMHRLPSEVKEKLDYSIESLDVLEEYLLSQFAEVEEIEQAPPDVLNGYAIYMGETFRKVLEDKTDREPNIWIIELDRIDNIYYNVPTIKVGGYIGCPHFLITASLDRRRGNYLSTILKNILED